MLIQARTGYVYRGYLAALLIPSVLAFARPAAADEAPPPAPETAPAPEMAPAPETPPAPETAPAPTPAPETAPTTAPTAAPAAETPPPPKWYDTVELSGYVDAYLSANFNRPSSRATGLRNFDIRSNEASLSQAKLTVLKKAAPVGFRLDLAFGPTADLIRSTEALPGAGPMGAPAHVSTFNNLQQAFVTWVAPVGKGLTLDVGEFLSPIGAESTDSKDNFNYSRSFLYELAIPYYHAGVRASYPLSSQLNAVVMAVNGWNDVVDNNNGKSFAVELAYTTGKMTATVNYITGPELAGDNGHFRHLVDGTVAYASPTLNAYVNGDFGLQTLGGGASSQKWYGGAAAVQLPFGKAGLAARAEYYHDDGATTGTKQNLIEGTVTGEYRPADGLMLRLEGRVDHSNQSVFEGHDGAKKLQPTVTLGAVAWF